MFKENSVSTACAEVLPQSGSSHRNEVLIAAVLHLPFVAGRLDSGADSPHLYCIIGVSGLFSLEKCIEAAFSCLKSILLFARPL
ncbi:hypothetical protein RRG08_041914 [Elysia crispata]|uniref:Uncharacterized protein n=1 Tax=Elysia crispata TaxID=231223 RepID=A0AAE0XX36_9GAST|nr:hypothetical protein RRG08_041914 [Elysia crispata]